MAPPYCRCAVALACVGLLALASPTAAETLPRPSIRHRSRAAPAVPLVAREAPESRRLRGGAGALSLSQGVPREAQLAFGALGIFLSFSVFAVLQEDVYKKAYGGEFFKYTFFVLVVERGINALPALAGTRALGGSGLAIPHRDIFNSGVSQMLAMAASNEALRYVSYPTQVLGKSCKMVPVMAGGIVLGGKTYTAIEYAQVVLITIGVCVFNFGGKKKRSGAGDSPLGLFLIGASLLMDAFTGGLQARRQRRARAWGGRGGE